MPNVSEIRKRKLGSLPHNLWIYNKALIKIHVCHVFINKIHNISKKSYNTNANIKKYLSQWLHIHGFF